MSTAASVEMIDLARYETEVDLHGKEVEIVGGHLGRIIRGFVVRTPEDALEDQLTDGRAHAETYHVKQGPEPALGAPDNRVTAIVMAHSIESLRVIEPIAVPAPR